MENPLLAAEPLPPFPRIRPEHVEPAMREVLAIGRRQLDAIAGIAEPTFACVVEPLEELQHRISRVWSPVNHLNGVLNSDALRASYNACLPLLSDYHTDLVAERAAVSRLCRHRGARGRTARLRSQRQVVEHALRDFRLAGVGLDTERKRRFKAVMLELTQLQSKFDENVLDATNAWTHHVADGAQLRGLNEQIVEQARARARGEEPRRAGC